MYARLLARNSGPIIVVDDTNKPYLMDLFKLWACPPGEGKFTCCTRKHAVERRNPKTGKVEMIKIECDKKQVANVMRTLLKARERDLERHGGDMSEFRWISCIEPAVLRGLSASTNDRKTFRDADHFLEKLHFAKNALTNPSADDVEDSGYSGGWTPLRYAALYGDDELFIELAMRAGTSFDVNAALRSRDHEFSHVVRIFERRRRLIHEVAWIAMLTYPLTGGHDRAPLSNDVWLTWCCQGNSQAWS